MKSIFLLLFAFSFIHVHAADPLLTKIRDKVRSIKDFTANATITLNVEFLKAKPSQAIVLYKSPGRLKIKSDGFSMLPKQGAGLPFAALLESPFTSVDLPDEVIKGINYKVRKVIPIADTGQIIVATVWIDPQKEIIAKMSAVTKGGSIVMDMTYKNEHIRFALPSAIYMSFDVPSFSLPKSMTGDLLAEKKPSNSKKNTKGSAQITYTSISVNKGISEDQFR
ncbi:MAG: LolA family protein [Candidatus Kapaibacteriota bacterium]